MLREISNSSADNSSGSDPRQPPRQTLMGQPPVGSPLQPRGGGGGSGGSNRASGGHPGSIPGFGDNAFSNGGGFSFGGGALGARLVPETLHILYIRIHLHCIVNMYRISCIDAAAVLWRHGLAAGR